MAGVSVQHLALALTVPPGLADKAGRLRAEAGDDFVPLVLSALADSLGARFGADAVIVVRKLRLAARLRPADLRDTRRAERLAQEIARQIAAQARRPRKDRAGQALQADVQLYRGRSEHAAVRLIAAAERHKTVAGRRQTVPELWADAEAIPVAGRLAILVEADRLGGLSAVLASLPDAAMAEVIRLAEDRAQLPASFVSALAQAWTSRRPTTRGRSTQGSASGTAPTAEVVPRGAAAPSGIPGQAGPPAETASPPTSRTDRRKQQKAPGGPDVAAPDTVLAAGLPIVPRAGPEVAPAGGGSGPSDRPPGQSEAPVQQDGSAAIDTGTGTVLHSDWSGLLCLVNISLRLGLPERLWQVGLDEGAALAGMLARLGGPDDPAALILAADFPALLQAAPVPDWAWAELATGLLPAADWGHAEERVEAIEAALRGDAPRSLATWGAAVHLAACEHLLGRPLPRTEVEALFRRPGRIVLSEGAITVIQPLDAIDIDLRRAGLDADPGWLPWLERTLTFRFAGDEDGA